MLFFFKRRIAALVLIFMASTFGIAGARNPYDALHDFELIPETVVPVDRELMAALLHEPERGLFAVVIFTADCEAAECVIEAPVAYSVFDTEGTRVDEYVDPRQEEHLLLLAGGKIA